MADMYIPADVTLRSVYPEPGSASGYAVLVDDLPRIFGFRLRAAAKDLVDKVDAGGLSSMMIAIKLTQAQAYCDLADEVDPERRLDSVTILDRSVRR